jgi:aspartyl-tRNA synthetase
VPVEQRRLKLTCTQGFDRLVGICLGLPSLRDVLAFPKSFTGRDLLCGSPAPLSPPAAHKQ